MERFDRPRMRPLLAFVLTVGVVILVAQVGSHPAGASLQATGPYCRAGVSGWHPLMETSVNAGWELSFTVVESKLSNPYSNGAKYVPMIRLYPADGSPDYGLTGGYKITNTILGDGSGELGDLVTRFPGRVWIVGNEVDRKDAQDSLMPQVYAEAYHDIYTFIKRRDPTAQVAISALVQVTPGRLQYLDLVWAAYKDKYGTTMPVDVWTFHIYPIPEKVYSTGADESAAIALGTDPNIAYKNSEGRQERCGEPFVRCYADVDNLSVFQEQVVSMRQWMKNNGQQNKPLLLTEYGIPWPYQYPGSTDLFYDEYANTFGEPRVTNYLNASTAYLETATDSNLGYPLDDYKLVQQWAWFTTYVDPTVEALANSSSLLNQPANGLTPMGTAFKDRISAQSLYVDLILEAVQPGVGFSTGGASTGRCYVDGYDSECGYIAYCFRCDAPIERSVKQRSRHRNPPGRDSRVWDDDFTGGYQLDNRPDRILKCHD